MISEETRRIVRERAHGRCEYCQLLEYWSPLPHTIDHIQPKQHMGTDEIDNLAYCCAFCNQQKGPNLAGIDPKTRRITRLFNPRTDEWEKHFKWDGVSLVGKTAIGRVIVYLMGVNDPERIATREALKLAGRW